MLEEKKLDDSILTVSHNAKIHIIEMDFLIKAIEQASFDDQILIQRIMSLINVKNGNLSDFLNYLAKSYIIDHESVFIE